MVVERTLFPLGGELSLMDNLIGELRRSAVLTTYAPGAIMDMRADGGAVSGVHAGLEEWDRGAPLAGNLKYQKVVERRLCKKLRKKYFRLPPVLEQDARYPGSKEIDRSALVARRFPSWLQCPKCELIKRASKWGSDPGRAARFCPECTGSSRRSKKKVYVVPVRFATACTSGHLDDFPWSFWVGHRNGCNAETFKFFSERAGLSGLRLSCIVCGASRSMDGVFSASALQGLTCQGRRPWLRSDDPQCACSGKDGTYRVVQRGASNLYYPVLESALAIPPWTESLSVMLGDYWDELENIESRDERIQYCKLNPGLKAIVIHEGQTAEWLVEQFEKAASRLELLDVSDLRRDEYDIFVSGMARCDPDFEVHPESVHTSISDYVSCVSRVARLREVRVVKGFTRIQPAAEGDLTKVAPLSVDDMDWLPAIEVRGEGIFIGLNIRRLSQWEADHKVLQRINPLATFWREDWSRRNLNAPLPYEITPRFLLLHTLSHALIRQLTIECGYSSASLRERLYVAEGEDGMAGVLIYTATPDSDGTLGGLQRRASMDLFEESFKAALAAMEWCSSDPLCITDTMTMPSAVSLASCHSCTMLSETSCEFHNRFLDRALLVGSKSDLQSLSFFGSI